MRVGDVVMVQTQYGKWRPAFWLSGREDGYSEVVFALKRYYLERLHANLWFRPSCVRPATCAELRAWGVRCEVAGAEK